MVRVLAIASCVFALASVGESGIAVARTWYVAVDGTGDAPTIAAAIDSSSSGDVILVGPGTHYVAKFDSGVTLKPSTSLLSELGPESTFLKPGAAFPPAQPTMIDVVAGCTVTGFDIEGGSVQTITTSGGGTEVSNNIVRSFGIAVLAGGTGVIQYNVCIGGGASIMLATYSLDLQIHNNTSQTVFTVETQAVHR